MDQIIAHIPNSVKGPEKAMGADAFGFGMRPEKRQGGGRQDRDLTGFPKPVRSCTTATLRVCYGD